jgi:hypothetical protein
MNDVMFSPKQYQALLKRLDEINKDVTIIRLQSEPGTDYLDNYQLMELLHVTRRTLQRWRKSGRLLSTKIGGKYYYKPDLVLEYLKPHMRLKGKQIITLPEISDLERALIQVDCPNCPLVLALVK